MWSREVQWPWVTLLIIETVSYWACCHRQLCPVHFTAAAPASLPGYLADPVYCATAGRFAPVMWEHPRRLCQGLKCLNGSVVINVRFYTAASGSPIKIK